MRLAFYAPLKPPNHDVPSGDRAMGRALMNALRHSGADVTLASTLRTRDGTGDTQVQEALVQQAAQECAQLITAGRASGWDAWVTYHNYYKAPDLIGPQVAQALGIPYLQIETSRARKRLDGPWARFAHLAEQAADAADTILYLTQRDAETLQRDAPQGQRLAHLRPFLDRHDLLDPSDLNGPILVVGMMRKGDKLASYRIIADTLALLPPGSFQVHIAGDGPARAEVEALMAPFASDVTFLGALETPEMERAYQRASIFLWPGVNEAFGLSYLEAQAAGVPVVAQNRPGVAEVLAPGEYPLPEEGSHGLAHHLRHLIENMKDRKAAGAQARTHVEGHHLLPSAATVLRDELAALGVSA